MKRYNINCGILLALVLVQLASTSAIKPAAADTGNAPIIDFSSYYGGILDDSTSKVAIDIDGNIILAFRTNNLYLPTTRPAGMQGWIGSGMGDIYVAKFATDGKNLLKASYIGGSKKELLYDLAVDKSNNIYLVGYTESADFPVHPYAIDTTFQGDPSKYIGDGFLAVLNPNCILSYATFIGGKDQDLAQAVAVFDNPMIAFVTGYTRSSDFSRTRGQSYAGKDDIFLQAINIGNLPFPTLDFSILIGGTEHEHPYAICLDAVANAYITGYTWSPNFPTTPYAYQRTMSGTGDVFVLEASYPGVIQYNTLLGGPNNPSLPSLSCEIGTDIFVDASYNIYVTGMTDSLIFPTTPHAASDSFHGGVTDGFVAKIGPSFMTLTYSTYLGGSDVDNTYGITIDPMGTAYITGETNSANFPVTPDAFSATLHSPYDAFLTKVAPNGQSLIYSTFIGGSSYDTGNALTLDNQGNLYISGTTSSSDFPTTQGAYNENLAGGNDAFLIKFLNKYGSDPVLISSGDTTIEYSLGCDLVWYVSCLMVNNPTYVIYRDGSLVNGPIAWPGDGRIAYRVEGLDVGTYTYKIIVNNGLGGSATSELSVTVIPFTSPQILSAPTDLTIYQGSTGNFVNWVVSDPTVYFPLYHITQNDGQNVIDVAAGYWESPQSTITFSVDGLNVGVYTYTLTVEDGVGGTASDEVVVTVLPNTPPTLNHPSDIYCVDYSGPQLTWIISDSAYIDPNAEWKIYMDGQLLKTNKWTQDQTTISLPFDCMHLGEHTYTFWVTDGVSSTSDDVVVVWVPPTVLSQTYRQYGTEGFSHVWVEGTLTVSISLGTSGFIYNYQYTSSRYEFDFIEWFNGYSWSFSPPSIILSSEGNGKALHVYDNAQQKIPIYGYYIYDQIYSNVHFDETRKTFTTWGSSHISYSGGVTLSKYSANFNAAATYEDIAISENVKIDQVTISGATTLNVTTGDESDLGIPAPSSAVESSYFEVEASNPEKVVLDDPAQPFIVTVTLPDNYDAVTQTLVLLYWNEATSQWEPTSFEITPNLEGGYASVRMEHLSIFALFANSPPIVTAPREVIAYDNEQPLILSWDVSDDSTLHATYSILRDGIPLFGMEDLLWDSTPSISAAIPVEDLDFHQYTLVFSDGLGFNDQHTIEVTISDDDWTGPVVSIMVNGFELNPTGGVDILFEVTADDPGSGIDLASINIWAAGTHFTTLGTHIVTVHSLDAFTIIATVENADLDRGTIDQEASTATIIISITNSLLKDMVLSELNTLIMQIQESDYANWRDIAENRKQVMVEKLQEVKGFAEAGQYADAYNKLLHDVKPKLTGVKSDEDGEVWGSYTFKNPWVVDASLQGTLGGTADTLLHALRWLAGGDPNPVGTLFVQALTSINGAQDDIAAIDCMLARTLLGLTTGAAEKNVIKAWDLYGADLSDWASRARESG